MPEKILKLIVEQNQLGYTGVFSKPALGLWADGARIFEGLLGSFSEFGLGLSDIRVDALNQSPAGQIVTADLHALGKYGFRFHQVEWLADNLTEDELGIFPRVLQRADNWLRSSAVEVSFISHTLIYSSHCYLSEGTSRDYLLKFPSRDISGMGNSVGAGIFYHWEIPDLGRFDLAVDHSRSVRNGLFIQAGSENKTDRLDFERVVASGRKKLENALASLGLEYER